MDSSTSQPKAYSYSYNTGEGIYPIFRVNFPPIYKEYTSPLTIELNEPIMQIPVNGPTNPDLETAVSYPFIPVSRNLVSLRIKMNIYRVTIGENAFNLEGRYITTNLTIPSGRVMGTLEYDDVYNVYSFCIYKNFSQNSVTYNMGYYFPFEVANISVSSNTAMYIRTRVGDQYHLLMTLVSPTTPESPQIVRSMIQLNGYEYQVPYITI